MNKEVLRRLDNLGRVVLPKDMRQRLFMNNGDPVEVTFENNSIILRPFVPLTEREGFFYLCVKAAKKVTYCLSLRPELRCCILLQVKFRKEHRYRRQFPA